MLLGEMLFRISDNTLQKMLLGKLRVMLNCIGFLSLKLYAKQLAKLYCLKKLYAKQTFKLNCIA
jgi:hypothetical protein